ncbi:protein suppressor of hairy wing-like isoform X2 [Armigeres subalbatus]|uniref:protein suppressor of hairy wing-like isoform X2 n=1 Tax=Armigeres subalbatus TaxID=124917 RepID=UPI002ED001D3
MNLILLVNLFFRVKILIADRDKRWCSLTRMSNLRDHMQTHIPIEERRKKRSLIEEEDKPKALKCYLCELTFKIRKTLRDHMKLVHGANKHECPVCKKPIAGWYLIKRHLRTHQPIHERQQSTAAVNCDICQKPFRDRAALGNHVIYVHGPRNHECEICGFRFPLRSSLRKHMNTHDPDPHKRRRPSEQTTKSKRKKRVVGEGNETSGTSRSFNKRQTIKDIDKAKGRKRQKKKKPRFHSCPLCNAKFATVVEFNKHIQQKHEEVLMDKAVEQKSNETQCMEHTESNEDVTFLFEAEEFKIEPE